MKSTNGQVQSKRCKAAGILLPKMGTKDMGTLFFYVVGLVKQKVGTMHEEKNQLNCHEALMTTLYST